MKEQASLFRLKKHSSKLLILKTANMKQCLTLFVVVFLFACKKTDVPIAVTEDVSGSAKADAPGNLHTRVLNNTLNFPWEIIWGPDDFIWFTEREGRVKKE